MEVEAKLYMINGDIIDKEPENKKFFTLAELQSFVGGYIEIIRLNDSKSMVLNEEGKIEGLPVNLEANKIFKQSFKLTNDYIVGNVLICDSGLIK